MSVSEDFVEFLSEGAVAIEVYGHKQANHRRNLALWDLGVIQAKTRSLRERSSDTNTQSSIFIQKATQDVCVTRTRRIQEKHFKQHRCYVCKYLS